MSKISSQFSRNDVCRERVLQLPPHDFRQNGASRQVSRADSQKMVFEKNGSFVNLNFRLQKFQQAVPGPAGLIPDIMLLGKLLSKLTGNDAPTNINSVWEKLSSENPAFTGISFASIPAEGQELDGSAYTQLDFPETKSLKFKPVLA